VALAPDDPEVSTRLLGLVRKELVRPSTPTFPDDEAFRFRHLLIRDAAYEALPKSERSVLHERFADWLVQHGSQLVELDEILGYHLEQAARYGAELGQRSPELEARAAAHLGAAGERAVVRDDAHAAASLLARAAELLPPGHDRGILLARLGLAYELLGRFADSEAVLDRAIETGGEDAAAFAYFIKVIVRSKTGVIDAADERAVAARLDSIAGSASDLTLASGYATLGLLQFWQGRVDDGLLQANRALQHARRAGDRDFERKGIVILGTAMMHGATPWPVVEEHAAEALALGFPRRSLEAAAAAAQGRFDESRALYAELTRDLFERGARLMALAMAMGSGWYELLAGETARALELLGESWAGLGELGEKGNRSTIGAIYADALARAGRADEADQVLCEVDGIASPDDFVTVAQAVMARGMIASVRGDHDRAVELAREGAAIADASEYLTQRHDAWMELGEVLLAAGRVEEARAALARSRELAEQKGSTAVVDRVDALLRAAATP
jgi:tetratricopeptide (TPR) repeat protein